MQDSSSQEPGLDTADKVWHSPPLTLLGVLVKAIREPQMYLTNDWTAGVFMFHTDIL